MTIPSFVSGTLFPPRDIDISRHKPPHLSKSKSDQVVTKRIVFDANTISKLKADQTTRLNCKPSTTEVLIALIWRAQINAARARHGRLRTSLLSSDGDDEDGSFSILIMKPYIEIFEEIRKGEGDVHVFSSLRNLPFYEVDFGWGKPAWVSFAHRVNKGVVFIDGKDGDRIEAWVHMEENEMAYFLKDPNIVMSMELSSRNAHKRNLPPETVVGSIEAPHVDDQRQKRLIKSLSENLTLYYPLAGRYIKENQLINCNDEGVEYTEALVNGELSQILQGEIEPKELNRFVPEEIEESATSALVSVQINIFNCGGLAIGVRVSHRIMDAFSASVFINGWAKACKVGNINDVTMTIPSFVSGILFPPRDIDISRYKPPHLSKSKSDQVVTKRIVFDANIISKLKADQATRLNCKPSTAEVLIALIWRAQINAARARHGRLRTSLLVVAMNLRGKKFKKIPENCCGNLFSRLTARFDQENERKIMGLNEFVDQVMGAIRNSNMEYAKVVTQGGDDEDGFFSKVIMKPYIEYLKKLEKKKEIFAQRVYKGVLLIDGKDGDGIEAWVTMEENEMAYFLKDPSIVMSMENSSRNGDGRNIPISRSKMYLVRVRVRKMYIKGAVSLIDTCGGDGIEAHGWATHG
ncbi:hypothetical protein JRO89_XS02G0037700 [Xanthoceras sorbifolium]|uniref:Uncharacterized protein n=1 Tax=Xanthoceras sorbifolium TaxID=99658 RepID=A0ABQ8IED3_9ROSI|nr:hypothetical protein JRO89_XS02G0037700 [Xanthoceras sorbifolium]